MTFVGFAVTTSPVDAVVGCGADPIPVGGANDGVVRIYSANVFAETADQRVNEVIAAVASEDPDVLVLQEMTGDLLAGMRNDARLSSLPHRTDAAPGVPSGEIIWSRWPIGSVDVERVSGIDLIHATIDGPTGPFVVTAVHATAPIDDNLVGPWQRQLESIADLDASNPRVLAGDFNATGDHRPFRTVLNAGWTDAQEEKGCGFDATWPVDGRLPLPVMRLDHVMVSDHWRVLDLRLGEPAGSDHLPVLTTILLDGT